MPASSLLALAAMKSPFKRYTHGPQPWENGTRSVEKRCLCYLIPINLESHFLLFELIGFGLLKGLNSFPPPSSHSRGELGPQPTQVPDHFPYISSSVTQTALSAWATPAVSICRLVHDCETKKCSFALQRVKKGPWCAKVFKGNEKGMSVVESISKMIIRDCGLEM